MKWFDKKGYKYNIISEHKGEEAGIKSSTIKVEGNYLYGLMRAESGVHRLVRISPFDSGAEDTQVCKCLGLPCCRGRYKC